MFSNRKVINRLAKITVFIFICMATPVSAGPPVRWDSMNINVSHSKCVKRASLAIGSEIAVDKIKKRRNGAIAWNKNTTIVVHCVAIGKNKSKNIIFVSGFKGDRLKGTLSQIKSAMRSGVFE